MSRINADGTVTFPSIAEYHREHDALVSRIDLAMRESRHSPEGTDGAVHYDFSRAESLGSGTEAEKVAELRRMQAEEAAQGEWYETVGKAIEAAESRMTDAGGGTPRQVAAAESPSAADEVRAGVRDRSAVARYSHGESFRALQSAIRDLGRDAIHTNNQNVRLPQGMWEKVLRPNRVTETGNFDVGIAWQGVISGAPMNDVKFMELIPFEEADQKTISETVEQVRPARAAAQQNEGDAPAAATDFNYQEAQVSMKRISRFGGLSDEAVRNGRRLMGVVEQEAPRILNEEISYLTAHGDGAGAEPNIRGIANMTAGRFSNAGQAIGTRTRGKEIWEVDAARRSGVPNAAEYHSLATVGLPGAILNVRENSRERAQWAVLDYAAEHGIRYAIADGDDHFLFPPQFQLTGEDMRIGGIPVLPCNEFPDRANGSVAGILGRSDKARGYWYGQVEFATTESHGNSFTEFTHTWRVSAYIGLLCRMPEAFCVITVGS